MLKEIKKAYKYCAINGFHYQLFIIKFGEHLFEMCVVIFVHMFLTFLMLVSFALFKMGSEVNCKEECVGQRFYNCKTLLQYKNFYSCALKIIITISPSLPKVSLKYHPIRTFARIHTHTYTHIHTKNSASSSWKLFHFLSLFVRFSIFLETQGSKVNYVYKLLLLLSFSK